MPDSNPCPFGLQAVFHGSVSPRLSAPISNPIAPMMAPRRVPNAIFAAGSVSPVRNRDDELAQERLLHTYSTYLPTLDSPHWWSHVWEAIATLSQSPPRL